MQRLYYQNVRIDKYLNLDRILSAVDNDDFTDFEDCLQEECAVNVMADYIVTRNPKDFEKSRVKIIDQEGFILLLQKNRR